MHSIFKLVRQLVRDTSGTALIESTLAVPIAISLMAGGVDFGMALSAQATGSKSIRDATRYLATVPANYVCSWGLANAKSLAVYGKFGGVDGVDSPLIAGWAMDGGANNNVQLGTITSANCANPANIQIIQLQANIPYSSIMLSGVLPSLSTMTLAAHHQERQIGQ